MTHRAWLLAAALSLAGCMNLAPRHERPPAPVATEFPPPPAAPEFAQAPAAPSGPPATELAWRDFYAADPRLQRLVELALANNRDLRVAVLNIEAARAQASAAGANRWPTVNAAVVGNRQPNASGDMTSSYSAGLAVSAWELDLFGRIRSATDAALAQLSASEAARQAAHIALVAAVAAQHVALAADEALLALTRQTLESRQESMRLLDLRFKYGTASEVDVRTGQTAVEAARTALLQLERQRALDRNALVLLVGQPLPDDLPAAAPWNPQTLADVPAGLPGDILLNRPDVRQAEEQLRAAEANIGVARAAFFPRITLTGSVGVASSELSGLFNAGTAAWTFMPQLLAPLFDAGRNRANLDLTQAQRGIAVAQYERAVQSAFRDVADVLAGRATLAQQVESARALAQAEAARFRLIELRFKNGVASSLELLDAQRSLFTAQQQQVQAEALLLRNRIDAYRALGGGSG